MFIESIIAKGISNQAIIKAMKKIPRKKFIPPDYQIESEGDYPLPIGYGQTISQPYIVAKMTELLELKENDKVLEIGTGSGYQTAVLAELVDEVYTIEIIEDLYLKAQKRLRLMGYNNINYKLGNGSKGWDEEAPFDSIICTCCPKDIPENILFQVKENGVLCTPIGEYNGEQFLVKAKKSKNNEIIKKEIFPVRFVPMLY